MQNNAIYLFMLVCLCCISCRPKGEDPGQSRKFPAVDTLVESIDSTWKVHQSMPEYWHCSIPVRMADYHIWMEGLVRQLQENRSYPIDEYLLIHANPWLMDSIKATDYYFLKAKGITNLDPQNLIILQQGDSLLVPDSILAAQIQQQLIETHIDINIPEYRLRIMRNDSTINSFMIRVGRNDRKYLAMAKKVIDLRTIPGEGSIVRINRDPIFINPRDNKRYKVTRRDDNIVTGLPNTPWLEPEINGMRYGQLIHPTTNLETLGKAYSNGCIGLREADAWTVFFNAPLGTRVKIRYNLQSINERGDSIRLKDIYPGFEKRSSKKSATGDKKTSAYEVHPPLCHCGNDS